MPIIGLWFAYRQRKALDQKRRADLKVAKSSYDREVRIRQSLQDELMIRGFSSRAAAMPSGAEQQNAAYCQAHLQMWWTQERATEYDGAFNPPSVYEWFLPEEGRHGPR